MLSQKEICSTIFFERILVMRNEQIVEKANSLIKMSFGRFYRGNYHIVGGGIGGGSLHERKDYLEVLASKMAWMGLGDPSTGVGIKGLFNADGSVIAVLKKFEHQAKKYAELYRQEFGQDVRVIVKEGYYDLFPTQGAVSQSPFPLDVNLV